MLHSRHRELSAHFASASAFPDELSISMACCQYQVPPSQHITISYYKDTLVLICSTCKRALLPALGQQWECVTLLLGSCQLVTVFEDDSLYSMLLR